MAISSLFLCVLGDSVVRIAVVRLIVLKVSSCQGIGNISKVNIVGDIGNA
jgi:hypothetical protein